MADIGGGYSSVRRLRCRRRISWAALLENSQQKATSMPPPPERAETRPLQRDLKSSRCTLPPRLWHSRQSMRAGTQTTAAKPTGLGRRVSLDRLLEISHWKRQVDQVVLGKVRTHVYTPLAADARSGGGHSSPKCSRRGPQVHSCSRFPPRKCSQDSPNDRA